MHYQIGKDSEGKWWGLVKTEITKDGEVWEPLVSCATQKDASAVARAMEDDLNNNSQGK